MDGLHIKITENLKPGQKSNFDKGSGVLTMPQAGTFTVSIREYEDENKAISDKLDALDSGLASAQNAKAKSKLNAQLAALKAKYAGVRWIYQAVGKDFSLTKDDFNKSFGSGITLTNVEFSELWQGGGMVYIEPYFYDPVTDPQNPKGPKIQMQPYGKPPYGCFVKGKGESDVITGEWKDKQGNLITGEVAFGSTVYLHIYTKALYGQLLDVKLQDSSRELLITDSGEDGSSSGGLDPGAEDAYFARRVSVSDFRNEAKKPPGNATVALVIDVTDKKQADGQYTKVPNVQKCMFPVFIERKWQYSGEDYDSNFKIHPIVTLNNDPKGKVYNLSNVILKVSEHGQVYAGELKGNSPVTVNELKIVDKKDPRKRKDFTFGVFIDGTMNDKYDTEARNSWENDQIVKKGGDINNPMDHLAVHAKSKADVHETGREKYDYKFGQTSYENALSNPAILFQYYVEKLTDATHLVLKVYSEGMGTNTEANDDGKIEHLSDYKKDDLVEGSGFGMGNAGIISRVKRAIQLTVNKIKKNLKDNETIGTLTVDVFGFSRGAAAARNFVHEITMQEYPAKVVDELSAYDHNDNLISSKYADPNVLLPAHGMLGYLLTENGTTFDNLVIRFAGLFDTVPHYGLIQSNDRIDLGLDSIMNANYTVHLVAGDEHRVNFSLVDISCIVGKKGGGHAKKGVELYLPGVHCDVGGSYDEGRPEANDPLNFAFSEDFINKDMQWLISNGWYKETEIEKYYNDFHYFLKGSRNYLSNQYSYIPLHMMLGYAMEHGPVFLDGALTNDYKFTDFKGQLPDNVNFLNSIETRLKAYADGTKERFEMVPTKTFTQPPYMTSPEHAKEAATEYAIKQKQGQAELDKPNADIKKLRNKYLHFNANYESLEGVNKPNFEGDRRVRVVRGGI
jgi:hypothetical protein